MGRISKTSYGLGWALYLKGAVEESMWSRETGSRECNNLRPRGSTESIPEEMEHQGQGREASKKKDRIEHFGTFESS